MVSVLTLSGFCFFPGLMDSSGPFVLSRNFECCCRRVLLFPKGNNVDHLSVYLDVADSAQLPYGWSRFAHFTLAVVNQYDPKLTVKKGS